VYAASEQLDESIDWPALNLADQNHGYTTMKSMTRGLGKATFSFKETCGPF
jgi:hypothetical protein